MTPQVKSQCLTTLARMLRYNSADTLAALLAGLPMASLVAALLAARDSTVVAFGMQVRPRLLRATGFGCCWLQNRSWPLALAAPRLQPLLDGMPPNPTHTHHPPT